MADNSSVVHVVQSLRDKLAADPTPPPPKILRTLQKLAALPISIDVLHETGIGKVVNGFRKYEGEIAESARSLVRSWKAMVREAMDEEASRQETPESQNQKEEPPEPSILSKASPRPQGTTSKTYSSSKHQNLPQSQEMMKSQNTSKPHSPAKLDSSTKLSQSPNQSVKSKGLSKSSSTSSSHSPSQSSSSKHQSSGDLKRHRADDIPEEEYTQLKEKHSSSGSPVKKIKSHHFPGDGTAKGQMKENTTNETPKINIFSEKKVTKDTHKPLDKSHDRSHGKAPLSGMKTSSEHKPTSHSGLNPTSHEKHCNSTSSKKVDIKSKISIDKSRKTSSLEIKSESDPKTIVKPGKQEKSTPNGITKSNISTTTKADVKGKKLISACSSDKKKDDIKGKKLISACSSDKEKDDIKGKKLISSCSSDKEKDDIKGKKLTISSCSSDKEKDDIKGKKLTISSCSSDKEKDDIKGKKLTISSCSSDKEKDDIKGKKLTISSCSSDKEKDDIKGKKLTISCPPDKEKDDIKGKKLTISSYSSDKEKDDIKGKKLTISSCSSDKEKDDIKGKKLTISSCSSDKEKDDIKGKKFMVSSSCSSDKERAKPILSSLQDSFKKPKTKPSIADKNPTKDHSGEDNQDDDVKNYHNTGMSFGDCLLGPVVKKVTKSKTSPNVKHPSKTTSTALGSSTSKADSKSTSSNLTLSSSRSKLKDSKHDPRKPKVKVESSKGTQSGEGKHLVTGDHRKLDARKEGGSSSEGQSSDSGQRSDGGRRHRKKRSMSEEEEEAIKMAKKMRIESSSDVSLNLPEIQPNYKPIHLPEVSSPLKKRVLTPEEEMAFLGSKQGRTKVFSGRSRINRLTSVPRLYDICMEILCDNIDALDEVGGVPYDILYPILQRCTPQQLFHLEDCNPHLLEDSDPLWQKHVERDFKGRHPSEMESWRELYIREHDAREARLKSITANISAQMAAKDPGRLTKMAFLDRPAKPPRNVMRQQQRHGTASGDFMPEKRSKSSVQPNRPSRLMIDSSGAEVSGLQRQRQQAKSAKVIAPMMMKTLKMIKKLRR